MVQDIAWLGVYAGLTISANGSDKYTQTNKFCLGMVMLGLFIKVPHAFFRGITSHP